MAFETQCHVGKSRLSEATGDVVLGELVARVGEYAIRLADLDEIAEMEISRTLRNARRLLHRVSHDDDGITLPQLFHEVLDARGGDRVESAARLVQDRKRVGG